MEKCFKAIRERISKNGGISNENCQNQEDNPEDLINEFYCLYNEKLKAIEDGYPESTPKCQALNDMINDLTEQNFILLKTVEELEKEALCRVEAFSGLAEAANDTIQQDVKSDLKQLLELMRRLREDKKFCACGLNFKTVKHEDLFGKKPLISPNSIEYEGDAICTKSDIPKFSRYRRYRMERNLN